MSYSNSFPTQRPTLNLDFANSGKLDSRISYARSSTGTALSSERHLSSENLLLQSQNFGTTWGVNATVASRSASSGTGPDGSDSWLQTAATSGSIWPSFNQSFGFKASTQYTYSIYLKAGTATHAWFAARGDAGNAVTGTLNFSSPGSIATTSVGGWTVNSSSVTAHGDWYRISITFTTNSTLSSPFVFVGLSDGTVPASYYPAGTPNGETVYVWGAQLEERGSATAYNSTTTQIHREFAPTLKTASANEPRFEYTTDGESEGLLIEAQATNLARYSSDISSWNATSTVNLTSNAGIAPNGQLEADLIVFPSSASQHYVYDNTISLTSGTTYTTSVYVKSAGQRYLQMCGNSGGFGYKAANYDLESAASSNVGGATSTITAVGNGWYRLTITMTADNTSATSGVILINVGSLSAGHFSATAGDDYSGVLCWGFQTETGSSASSIISTSGATATKSADSCSVALSEINYSGGEVSLLGEGTSSDQTNYRGMLSLHLDSSNFISLYAHSAYNRRALIKADGVGSELSGGAGTKAGLSVGTNDVSLCVDGGAVTTDASQTLPDLTGATAYVGSWSATSNQINGHIKRLSLYSVALSDTELQALTS